MAGTRKPRLRRPRPGLVRPVLRTDPVVLIGIGLSIALSIALDLTGAASGVESLQAGLLGIIIALVLDASARAERRFQLRTMIYGTGWLPGELTTLATTVQEITRRYPDTEVEAEARHRFRQLAEELDELRRGRITRSSPEDEHLIAVVATGCLASVEAVTNIIGPPQWWRTEFGRRYWQANLDALARGVRITRVFICDRVTDDLTALLREQEQAGVTVRVARRKALDPALNLNFAIFDGRSAWEAQMNARGEIVGNVFLLNEHEVRRLTTAFGGCLAATRAVGD